ncbi:MULTISPECIES: hypothetical protein [Cyanophyceae]|uniref:hypothetical protein n=1 Tax=Cyanophyceae TaxID=3028117 RepID=UPI0016889919|nr:hypothetical protein [Trichocoleus sp. FACHB-69]MBD1934130.1 hypothetical protein [Trichocoleus sp. FACHB-69]
MVNYRFPEAQKDAVANQSIQHSRSALSKTAAKVLQDPLLLRQLSDQVYKLMIEDLRRQRERSRN